MESRVQVNWLLSILCVGLPWIQDAARSQQPSDVPTLTFLIEPSGNSDPNCFAADQEVVARIHVGPATSIINGGQFVIEYDTSCLQFKSAVPAGPPYTKEIWESVDEDAGTLVYAVGIEFGGSGAAGDADLAVLTFTKMEDCAPCELCFGGKNPINTYLVDNFGQPVLVEPFCSKAIKMSAQVTLLVPDNAVLEASCAQTAEIEWLPPAATSTCGAAVLDCQGVYVETGDEYDDEIVQSGGTLPVGLSIFCCTAANNCGIEAESCWEVTVNPLPPPQADPAEASKNRYLSFFPGTSEQRTALRVTLMDIERFPSANGSMRWLGPPSIFEINPALGETALASALQCSPYYQEWDADELLHVYGAAIVPGSDYGVDAIAEGCSPNQWFNFSQRLSLTTAVWGDVTEPFGPPSFLDIAAVVDGFRVWPTAPPKTQTQLQPNIPNPLAPISFGDIDQAANAFRNRVYSFAGPGTCP